MATLKAKRTRGRKKGQLRIEAAALIANVAAAPGPEVNVTVEVAPKKGNKKAETIAVALPKGSVAVPQSLIGDKKDENVREQLRLAAKDAERTISIASATYTLDGDDETELVAWFLVPKAAKAPASKPKSKAKA